MLTSLLNAPLIMPVNGCSNGVGVGGGTGTMTMCVSVATILSPCLAAGCPIAQFMLTVAPLMFMVPDAFTSIPLPDSSFVAADDLTSIVFASSLMAPLGAESTMSLSLV